MGLKEEKLDPDETSRKWKHRARLRVLGRCIHEGSFEVLFSGYRVCTKVFGNYKLLLSDRVVELPNILVVARSCSNANIGSGFGFQLVYGLCVKLEKTCRRLFNSIPFNSQIQRIVISRTSSSLLFYFFLELLGPPNPFFDILPQSFTLHHTFRGFVVTS